MAPPITMTQIVYLIADAEHLMKKIPELFDETIKPHIQALGFQDLDILRESLMEAVEGIRENLPPFDTYITDEITAQCAVHLKLVSDIPRLYRRTNREVCMKSLVFSVKQRPSQDLETGCPDLAIVNILGVHNFK